MKERRKYVREMSERREFIRFSIDQMIEISYGKENYIHASGINLSEKGILCRTSDYVDLYTRVFLMFQVPVGGAVEPVKCEGIVLRSVKEEGNDHYNTAISFASLEGKDQELIEQYSRERLAAKKK